MAQIKVALVNLASPNFHVRELKPVAVNILAGYLRKRALERGIPVQVKVYDMQEELEKKSIAEKQDHKVLHRQTAESIAGRLAADRPDIVGLSMRWETLNAALSIISKMRGSDILPLVITGNNVATYGSRKLLTLPEFKDTLAVEGEGEDALCRIVERAITSARINDPSNYEGIPNVRTKPDGDIFKKRVDLINYPDLDLTVAEELYKNDWAGGVEFSRGCPYHSCRYCSIGDDWKPFKTEIVINRMRRLLQADPKTGFWSNDSEFFGHMNGNRFYESIRTAEKVAKAIEELGKELKAAISVSHFSARVDNIFKARDGEDRNTDRIRIIRKLMQAGFGKVYLGIESGSPSQLIRYGKGVTANESREAMRLLDHEIHMPFEPGYIFFDPDATIRELRESMLFIKETGLHRRQSRIFNTLRPQAGSRLTAQLIAKGLVSPDLDLDTVSHRILDYSDKDVKVVAGLYGLWEKQSADLFRYLNGKLYWKGTNPRNAIIGPFLDKIIDLDRTFINGCLDACEAKSDHGVAIAHFSKVFINIIDRIKFALANHHIDDPDGQLPLFLGKATERNMALPCNIDTKAMIDLPPLS
ncbi:MAG: hypothetical protein NTZ10_04530 [Candidatus Saganbacteria bacterium]|nr:hypothetical protein [Candidatus Saganbacteria bacterium]